MKIFIFLKNAVSATPNCSPEGPKAGPKGPKPARRAQNQPEGPKAGPKGRNLEVGAQRAPRLLVFDIAQGHVW